ncbi:MAG: hypothetical protein ABR998_04650 [Gemmatimonadales bacterium]|jgi:hypothetical protein
MNRNSKTAFKSAPRLAPAPPQGGARLPLGAHPANTGGKKGRSGRPPAAFKQFARALYGDPEVRAQIQLILRNRREKHFASVLKALLPIVTTTEDAQMLAHSARQNGLRIKIMPSRKAAES